MKKLYVTIGISGSGKSTYLKKHFKPEVIVCPDLIRKEFTGDISNHTMEPVVWATANKRIQDNLEKYGEAVLDATNVNAKYRRGFLTPYVKMNDVEKIALVFPAKADVSKSRVKNDIDTGVDRSNVPDHAIDKQLKNYEAGYQAIFHQFDKVEVVEEQIKMRNILREIMGDRK